MSAADTEALIRKENREWIARANTDQLRDLAFWLNAYNPLAFAAAIEDEVDDE